MPVQYGGDKITFADGSTVGSGWTGMKNRIINGAMMIDQRNAGAVYSSLNGYSLDRWFVDNNTNTVGLTTQQSSVAPSGFVNSLIHTVTGTGASPASGNRNRFGQRIEGFNAADLMWGTANAQTVTLSFWVRSSLTGTFSGGFGNNSANRSYVFTYVVNSANTWEYKTITIAGDTTGTWTTNNSAGIAINFDIGSGSNFVGTAGAWSAGDFFKSSGSVSLVSNSGATFYITGVQLEKGSTATSFDYRSYSVEELLCKRYCHVWSSGGQSYTWVGMGFTYSGGATAHYRFPVIMRASPTATFSEQNKWIADYFNGNSAVTGMSISYVSPEQCRVNATCSPPTNYPFALANNGDAGTRTIVFSAEL